ncbi:hypothetical protein K1719_001945 [Acacia pycnantha]|nr:hypothetical protein K1719_001945 [Acacia pycnantha]
MLSLREFCYALYLMERYRESRTLPPSLPNNILYDEMLLSLTTASVSSERVISFDMRGSNVNAWWYKLEYIITELNINSVTTTPCHTGGGGAGPSGSQGNRCLSIGQGPQHPT